MKRILTISLLLLAIIIGNFGFLIYHDPLPADSPYHWPLATLEQQFSSTEKHALPIAIHSETIAYGTFPPCFAVAHCGETHTRADFTSFQIVYGDGKTIVIDLVHDADFHHKTPFTSSSYDHNAAQRMITAARQATHVVLTHEHFDHMQGLKAVLDDTTLTDHIALNPQQATNPLNLEAGFDATDQDKLKNLIRLKDTEVQVPEPGFAIIKTPGHSLGSQSFYVHLQNGERFLFVGDIVWSEANLQLQRGKPLLTSMLIEEDSLVLNQQIRSLISLQQQQPALHLVIAHAGEQLNRYHQKKLITAGFVTK